MPQPVQPVSSGTDSWVLPFAIVMAVLAALFVFARVIYNFATVLRELAELCQEVHIGAMSKAVRMTLCVSHF